MPQPGALEPVDQEAAPPDLDLADWWAAERRRAQSSPATAAPAEARPAQAGPAVPGEDRPGQDRPAPAWKKHRRWVYFTRAWALAKMGLIAYSSWWAMGYLHFHRGAEISGYGVVCLFSGVGAHWRKRYFGPGQQLEPELYEVVAQWLYRAGTVLVLVGGAIAIARAA